MAAVQDLHIFKKPMELFIDREHLQHSHTAASRPGSGSLELSNVFYTSIKFLGPMVLSQSYVPWDGGSHVKGTQKISTGCAQFLMSL